MEIWVALEVPNGTTQQDKVPVQPDATFADIKTAVVNRYNVAESRVQVICNNIRVIRRKLSDVRCNAGSATCCHCAVLCALYQRHFAACRGQVQMMLCL